MCSMRIGNVVQETQKDVLRGQNDYYNGTGAQEGILLSYK